MKINTLECEKENARIHIEEVLQKDFRIHQLEGQLKSIQSKYLCEKIAIECNTALDIMLNDFRFFIANERSKFKQF